jgi:hypothetical protein
MLASVTYFSKNDRWQKRLAKKAQSDGVIRMVHSRLVGSGSKKSDVEIGRKRPEKREESVVEFLPN